jgi:hypothetical protein
MIAFTVLGVLVFWLVMFGAGWFLGMWLDVRRGMKVWVNSIDSEVQDIRVLVDWLVVHGRPA